MSVATVEVAPVSAHKVARRETTRALLRSKTFVIGAAIILWWVFCAFFGATIAPHDPLNQTPHVLAAPSGTYWFGTDQLGRDVFSRVLAGARNILLIAPAATGIAIVAGTALGLITGYLRGAVDDGLSLLIGTLLTIPLIVLGVTVITALGRSNVTTIIVVGVLFTPLVARTVRAAVLAERELDYVPAARLRGERGSYVMFAEILPNVTGPIIVEATVRLGYAVFIVAGLTFLGFGVQPPTPDWAGDIATNYTLLASGSYWWTVLFPALAIATLVIAINMLADALTQVLER
jgi:peptide/nickel transport system permease protein